MADPTRLLVVDDNDLDVEKIRRGMTRLNVLKEVVHARDGLQALDMLRGTGGFEPLGGRIIILLDLNMPKMNGIEFLAECRGDERLRHIPVFVLTTSMRPVDIEAAYGHNVSGYVVKPIVMDEMRSALESLNAFWDICQIPNVEMLASPG